MDKTADITKLAKPLGLWLGVGALVSGGSARDTTKALFLDGLGITRKQESEFLAITATLLTVSSLVMKN